MTPPADSGSVTVSTGPGVERLSLAKALNSGLRRAMRDDPKVVLLGEDIGTLGGVFRVTEGLQEEFGRGRVIDTPLAESGIVGTAIGMALRGYRPVCEIQFDGFIYPAFDQIVSQLAKMRARSGGILRLPVTIRVPFGGGIGAVEHHSESNEAYFCHTAGLRVVACSSPADGYELIRAAIACDDPVIFYEPKRRYWDSADVELSAPTDDSTGLSTARILSPGSDVTLIAYGPALKVAVDAAVVASAEGRSVEVIDLRTLSPLDVPTLAASASRTGRVVIIHEAPDVCGAAALRSRAQLPSDASTDSKRRYKESVATTCPIRQRASKINICRT